ncbi:MAG: 3-hydroxyacyl-CoA dehydrogenase NAD-binding domain-containing protein [Chloroflexota bacterium]|nr:3-hydroxyacyl-CoA dehydrogenase NAD-binding domain-containing protein [Chloroflexota bacterium]
MGCGIAQVVAEAGPTVTLYDVDRDAATRGMEAIVASWQRAIARGRRTETTVASAAARLTPAASLDAARDVDLVIEAIVERADAKTDLFRKLSSLAPARATLASNTSSISITRLAAATTRPAQVIGLHFFNPVPSMALVEVVRGLQTSDATVASAMQFARRLGKSPVLVNDYPGFVSNRILLPMINEAIFCLGEGVAEATAIDDVMKLGMAHPMGPLALADLIGLDVCLDILHTLQQEIGDDKYRPAPLLRRLVAAGKLGRKSGQGFFSYDR